MLEHVYMYIIILEHIKKKCNAHNTSMRTINNNNPNNI